MVQEPVAKPRAGDPAWIASQSATGGHGKTSEADIAGHGYFVEPLHLDRSEDSGAAVTARITHEAAGPAKVDVSSTPIRNCVPTAST